MSDAPPDPTPPTEQLKPEPPPLVNAGPPPPAPPERGSWTRRGLVLLGLFALMLILGPWLLTHSLLTSSLRRSLQSVGGEEALVGNAAIGWRSGLTVEQLSLPKPPEGAPAVLLGQLRLETDLISGASGWFFGTPVKARLVMRRTSVDYTVPPANLAQAPPPAQEGSRAPLELPCPLLPSMEIEGFDLACTWTPGAVSPRRATLLGMNAKGGGQVERDLAMDLDQGFECTLEELRIEQLDGPEGPGKTLLVIEKPSFRTARLKLPPLALFSTNQVETEMSLTVPVMRVANMRFTDMAGKLVFAQGKARMELGATAPQGRLEMTSALDLSKADRWPAELNVAVKQMQLTGDLAKAAPYLVPLLRAHRTKGGTGLPPIDLGLDAKLALTYDAAGALDWETSLNTLAGKGTFAMGPGNLSSSILIDGYTRALTGLGISSLLAQVLPRGWTTKGVSAAFELPGGGIVKLPRLEIRNDVVPLEITGQTKFSGEFELQVKTLGEGKEGLAAVLEAIDDAGGIWLTGDLTTGTISPRLPEMSALVDAARKRNVLALLQENVSGGKLKEALEKLPGELKKIPEGLPR